MLRIHWQNRPLAVRRLVVARTGPDWYFAALNALAAQHELPVVPPETRSRPGDLWIGCYPEDNWAGVGPDEADWATPLEIWDVIRELRRAAAAHPVAYTDEPDAVPVGYEEVDEDLILTGRFEPDAASAARLHSA